MSDWDDESGWRRALKCPDCGQSEIWYTGHVDVTQVGDTNRACVRGAYLCKNVDCRKFEQQVAPVGA